MTTPLSSQPALRWVIISLIVGGIVAAGIYFFQGFLVPVLAALIIAFASWPVYKKLVRACGGNTALSATIALCTVLLVLVIPLFFAISYAVTEIRSWVIWLVEANKQGIPVPQWIPSVPFAGRSLQEAWQTNLAQPNGIGELIQLTSGEHIGNISRWVLAAGGGAFNLLLSVLFILIALFFIYKDGSRLVAQLDRVGERLLPHRWQRFSRVVPATVSSTVTGMTLIAVGEGIILGIAYKIAGVPSAFLLGVLTGFMALVPGGAPIAFTSVSLYLVGSGNVLAGVLLFAWGSVELFIVDKTLRPKLVGGPIRLPFLPTFFGLIGGVKTMGLVGLFVGPVLMALIVAIWREWVLIAETDAGTPPGQSTLREPPREEKKTELARV